MDKVVEAVARDVYGQAPYDEPWDKTAEFIRRDYLMEAETYVRATLKAIEEPSEEMINAGAQCSHSSQPWGDAKKFWKAMLQALTKSIEGGTN